jgi:hypothetical protein
METISKGEHGIVQDASANHCQGNQYHPNAPALPPSSAEVAQSGEDSCKIKKDPFSNSSVRAPLLLLLLPCGFPMSL